MNRDTMKSMKNSISDPARDETLENLMAENDAELPPEVEARLRPHLNALYARAAAESPSAASGAGRILAPRRFPGRVAARWATAGAAAALIAALATVYNPFGHSAARAYAEVAAQLRGAQTIACDAVWAMQPGEPATAEKIAFRAPATLRAEITWQGATIVEIIDMAQQKGIILDPVDQAATEVDVKAVNSLQGSLHSFQAFAAGLQSIPAEADAVIGTQTIDGRETTGFRVGDRTLWIDVASQSLIRMERPVGAGSLVAENFQLNPPSLHDADFSLALPAGYAATTSGPVMVDETGSSEADLIEYLRQAALSIANHQFPSTVNPLELLALSRQGKLVPTTAPLARQQAEDAAMLRTTQRAIAFVTQLPAGSDWHYAGGGVALGEGSTPIAWWRAAGTPDYRVIWGDLRVTDETAGTFAAAKRR